MLKYTIGRGGLISPAKKREGDGCTPSGSYPIREVWYRADRVAKPETKIPIRQIMKEDCWCDDAEHALYNRHFKLDSSTPLPQGEGKYIPPASYEHLWREDGAYDVIVVIGYNGDPPIPHKGSAIFIHCNHDDGRPTAGCVALDKNDLLVLLKKLDMDSKIEIGETNISIR